MSEKPVIFISHSSKDRELAINIKNTLEVLIDSVQVFAAPLDILTGDNWYETIMKKLDQSASLILLLTPHSNYDSRWVWFELGYFWSIQKDEDKNKFDKRRCYPLYLGLSEIPDVIKDLHIQAKSLSSKASLREFLRDICDQHLGNVSLISLDDVFTQISTYAEKKLQNINYPVIPISSHPEGASQEYLKDYLYEQYLAFNGNLPTSGNNLFTLRIMTIRISYAFDPSASIFGGKVIVYEYLDRGLNLFPGTSKEYLKEYAKQYGLTPIREHRDSIRFEYDPNLDEYLLDK